MGLDTITTIPKNIKEKKLTSAQKLILVSSSVLGATGALTCVAYGKGNKLANALTTDKLDINSLKKQNINGLDDFIPKGLNNNSYSFIQKVQIGFKNLFNNVALKINSAKSEKLSNPPEIKKPIEKTTENPIVMPTQQQVEKPIEETIEPVIQRKETPTTISQELKKEKPIGKKQPEQDSSLKTTPKKREQPKSENKEKVKPEKKTEPKKEKPAKKTVKQEEKPVEKQEQPKEIPNEKKSQGATGSKINNKSVEIQTKINDLEAEIVELLNGREESELPLKIKRRYKTLISRIKELKIEMNE